MGSKFEPYFVPKQKKNNIKSKQELKLYKEPH